MQAKEKQEFPSKWFILPNESYKWDFILDKQVAENPKREAADSTEGIRVFCDEIDVLPIKLGSHFLARNRSRNRQVSPSPAQDV
jgi:hypothetical protein